MAQMKRFVGVRRRVFDHHQRAVGRGLFHAEVLVLVDGLQQVSPGTVADAQVQEAFYHVELVDGCTVFHHILSDFLAGLFGTLAGHLDEGEHHQRQVAFKLAACLLQLQHLLAGLYAVECLYGLAGSTADQCLDIHLYFFCNFGAKVRKSEQKAKGKLIFFKTMSGYCSHMRFGCRNYTRKKQKILQSCFSWG